MDSTKKSLIYCPLFKGLSKENIYDILQKSSYTFSSFTKNQLVAVEGENCSSIGIITEGSIEIKKIFASGRTITITTMKAGDIFGEAIIFSDAQKFPATIISTEKTKIIFLPKDSISEASPSKHKVL